MTTARILITGATGFTGGHLCQRFATEGYHVRALVRDHDRGAEMRRWGVETVLGDLRDRQSVERAMGGVNVVYHVAALFRPENLSRREMWEVNVQGTQYMLDAAVQAGVERFVHCSTVGVHGDVQHPPANERAPYRPGDYYQASKTDAEKLVLEYGARGQLPIVVFRPGGIYGPRDLRFLKLFKAIKRRRFVMLGSGKVLYQLIYIDDLINGIVLCGTEAHALGNVYILTGQEAVSLNHLAQTIADVLAVAPPRLHFPVTPVYVAGMICETICKPLGVNPPLYRRRVDFFRKTRSFDVSKAMRELGFKPRIDLQTGLSLTARWYQKEHLL
jgi:nucleoside-diphosphate-sugar epimerase